MPRLLLALILLAPSFLYAADPADVVKNADKQFNADTCSQGLEGWMKWFAPDGYVGNDPRVRGTDELRRFYTSLFSHKDLSFQWSPAKAEVFPSGTMGYTSGHYNLSFTGDNGKKVNRTGNYLTVWQKQKDGSWKVLADFGSLDSTTE
jgi:ketosteroid isomerase-like protein